MSSSDANQSGHGRRIVRFGRFEFDLVQLKPYCDGCDLDLQQQPAMLLAYVVNRVGAPVTRDEIREATWPLGVYVEFDAGLNTAISRLRRVMRDSAAEPIYIETIPTAGISVHCARGFRASGA